MSERERSSEQEPSLLAFPFPLPERFLDRIGYPGPYSLVGLYWEALGDELTAYDPESLWCGMHNHWPYLELMRHPQVWHWLDEYLVDLGSSETPATHHLIVHRELNEAFILDRVRALRAVRQQSFQAEDFLLGL